MTTTIQGTFSKLKFSGQIAHISNTGMISVLVNNPHKNLPIGPCWIDDKWLYVLSFHPEDRNVTYTLSYEMENVQ